MTFFNSKNFFTAIGILSQFCMFEEGGGWVAIGIIRSFVHRPGANRTCLSARQKPYRLIRSTRRH